MSSGTADYEDILVKRLVAERRTLRSEEKVLITRGAGQVTGVSNGHARSTPDKEAWGANGKVDSMQQDSDESAFYDEESEPEMKEDEDHDLPGEGAETDAFNTSHRPPMDNRPTTPNHSLTQGRMRASNAGASSPSQIVFVERPTDKEAAATQKRRNEHISSSPEHPSKDQPNEPDGNEASSKTLKLTEHKALSDKQEKLLKDAISSACPDAEGNYRSACRCLPLGMTLVSSKGKQALHKGDVKSAEIFFQQALKVSNVLHVQ